MKRAIFGVAAATVLLAPATAQAHHEATGVDPLSHGLFHLLVGPLGVLAVGLILSVVARRSRDRTPRREAPALIRQPRPPVTTQRRRR